MKTLALTALLLILAALPAGAEGKGLDTKISANFVDTPMPDALAFLARTAGIDVNLDPQFPVGRLVIVKFQDLTARAALTLVAGKFGLSWDERWGGVFVAKKERLDALSGKALPTPSKGEATEADQALRSRMVRELVSFDFDRTGVIDCLEFIQTVQSLNIVVDDAIRAEVERMQFSGVVAKATVGDALALLLIPRGLTASIRSGVVFVSKAGPVEPPAEPAVKKNVPKVLDTTKLSVHFLDTDLARVADYLGRRLKYPVHVDPRLLAERSKKDRLITVKIVREVTGRTVLDLVAMTARFDWDIRWGGVFFATKDRLAALSKDVLPGKPSAEPKDWEGALRRALTEKRISLAFGGTSLVDALSYIRDQARMNILIEPKAAKAAAETTIDLRVTERPIGETLTLLLVPQGFTFVLAHEVVVVRRAK